MSTSDSGAWKLLIYPIIIIFVIGAVFNFTLKPFLDTGIYPQGFNDTVFYEFNNSVYNGLPINVSVFGLFNVNTAIPSPITLLPSSFKTFFGEQLIMIFYLPLWLLYPLIFIIAVGFIYVLWVLVGMWIP